VEEGLRSERRYRIGELANLSGVPVSTLRYWERRGFLGGWRTKGGQRLFDDRDLRWVIRASVLTESHHMTEKLASTVELLVHADAETAKPSDSVALAVGVDANDAERMLSVAVANARLFAEQRELVRELTEGETLYRMLLNMVQEGILVAKANGTISVVNDSMAALLGYRREDIEGRQLADFTYDVQLRSIQNLFEEEKIGALQISGMQLLVKNGRSLPCNVRLLNIPIEGGIRPVVAITTSKAGV
jgi:PAS domain S-box-containing protein